MLKKITLMIVAVFILSLGQAFAKEPPIYDKDNKAFVQEFNAAAKNFGNFKMTDFKYVMTLDDRDLYDAIIEGAGKELSEAVMSQNEDKKIARFSIVVDNRDASEKLFKAALAVFKVADMPYKEMDDVTVKTADGKTLKVSLDFYKGDKDESYTFTFRT